MRVASVFLIAAMAAAASAQVNESITINYVEVPVTVADRNGNPIRGLTKANFEILDEGKKREIAGFESIDFASRNASSAPITPAARRNFLVLFDLTFSSPSSISRAKEAAREFATKMMKPDDRIAVATIDVAHGFRLLTSFTTDRTVVAAAIDNPAAFTTLDPLQLAATAVDRDVAASMNEAGKRANPENEDKIQAINRLEDSYNREKVNGQMSLLAGLAAVLRGVRGQKHILLLSEGFDPRLVLGRDTGTDKNQQRREATALESAAIWGLDNDNRYGSTSSQELVKGLADVAKRSDVILDAVDIRGVRSQFDPRQGLQHKTEDGLLEIPGDGPQGQSNEALHLIASSTGGTVFQNSNDLANDFQRAVRAQEVVYVLSFQAPLADPSKFHDLKVRLVNVPGGHAIARSGYYEGGAGSSAERTLRNAEIIVDDIPQTGVHLASNASAFEAGGPEPVVAIVVEIDGKDVVLPNGGSPTVEVYTYAFDEHGTVRASNVRRISVDAAKLGTRLLQRGVKYYEMLSLPAGSYAVKTLVRVAESDKKGYVRTNVVVPDKAKLPPAPSLVADQHNDWLMVRDEIVRK